MDSPEGWAGTEPSWAWAGAPLRESNRADNAATTATAANRMVSLNLPVSVIEVPPLNVQQPGGHSRSRVSMSGNHGRRPTPVRESWRAPVFPYGPRGATAVGGRDCRTGEDPAYGDAEGG